LSNIQLAEQVGDQAKNYGIDVAVMVKGDYPRRDAWMSGDVIAVTTYSRCSTTTPD